MENKLITLENLKTFKQALQEECDKRYMMSDQPGSFDCTIYAIGYEPEPIEARIPDQAFGWIKVSEFDKLKLKLQSLQLQLGSEPSSEPSVNIMYVLGDKYATTEVSLNRDHDDIYGACEFELGKIQYQIELVLTPSIVESVRYEGADTGEGYYLLSLSTSASQEIRVAAYVQSKGNLDVDGVSVDLTEEDIADEWISRPYIGQVSINCSYYDEGFTPDDFDYDWSAEGTNSIYFNFWNQNGDPFAADVMVLDHYGNRMWLNEFNSAQTSQGLFIAFMGSGEYNIEVRPYELPEVTVDVDYSLLPTTEEEYTIISNISYVPYLYDNINPDLEFDCEKIDHLKISYKSINNDYLLDSARYEDSVDEEGHYMFKYSQDIFNWDHGRNNWSSLSIIPYFPTLDVDTGNDSTIQLITKVPYIEEGDSFTRAVIISEKQLAYTAQGSYNSFNVPFVKAVPYSGEGEAPEVPSSDNYRYFDHYEISMNNLIWSPVKSYFKSKDRLFKVWGSSLEVPNWKIFNIKSSEDLNNGPHVIVIRDDDVTDPTDFTFYRYTGTRTIDGVSRSCGYDSASNMNFDIKYVEALPVEDGPSLDQATAENYQEFNHFEITMSHKSGQSVWNVENLESTALYFDYIKINKNK